MPPLTGVAVNVTCAPAQTTAGLYERLTLGREALDLVIVPVDELDDPIDGKFDPSELALNNWPKVVPANIQTRIKVVNNLFILAENGFYKGFPYSYGFSGFRPVFYREFRLHVLSLWVVNPLALADHWFLVFGYWYFFLCVCLACVRLPTRDSVPLCVPTDALCAPTEALCVPTEAL